MNQFVWYKNEKIRDYLLQTNIEEISKIFKNNYIYEKDIVICKGNTQLDIYIQWLACLRNDILPIFVFSEVSNENIYNWNTNLGIKAILESKNGKHTIHKLTKGGVAADFLKEIDTGSVIHLTSATTGNPKLVLRTKQQLDAELERYSRYLKISEKDVVLPIVPINHSFGFISGMLLSIKTNATLVLPDNLLPRNIVQLSNKYKVTMMLGIPYFYRKMIEISNKYHLNNELRYIIASGGPMEKGLQREFRQRFGKKLLQQYGSTETGSLAIGYSEINNRYVGKPIPGAKVEIMKDKFLRSCLYVNSAETIGGYITETGIEWLNGKYKTGDMANIDSSGGIELLGRCDDVLIVDGKKVDKRYVETCIKTITGITEAKIYLGKSGTATELICKYTGEQELSKEKFITKCKPVLATFQIPKKFIYVENTYFQSSRSWKAGF